MMTVRGLTVRRGARILLADVAFDLQPGRVTGILGPNGAGKSTLLRCLSGTMKPDGGEVQLRGRSLRDWRGDELALQRAVLGQENRLGFAFAVHEVVALGRIPHAGRTDARTDWQAVSDAMAVAGVTGMADRDFTTLSGGEKQRVHLARTLCQLWPFDQPGKLLLLDEPTNNLDLKHQHGVLRHARQLAGMGLTVVAVLHEPNLALAYADDALVLSDGRLAGQGTVGQVLTGETLSRVYGLDLQRVVAPGHAVPLVVAVSDASCAPGAAGFSGG